MLPADPKLLLEQINIQKQKVADVQKEVNTLQNQIVTIKNRQPEYEKTKNQMTANGVKFIADLYKKTADWADRLENKHIQTQLQPALERLASEQQYLALLESEYQKHTMPGNKQNMVAGMSTQKWSFEGVSQEVSLLIHQLIEVIRQCPQPQKITDTITNIQKGGLIGFLDEAARAKDEAEAIQEMEKLSTQIKSLQITRRTLLPLWLQSIAGWDKYQLTTEMQQRNRDLADLPALAKPESKVQRTRTEQTYAPLFIEERRFLEDVIYQLSAILRRMSEPAYAVKPQAAASPTPQATVNNIRAEIKQEIKDATPFIKSVTGIKILNGELKGKYPQSEHSFIDSELEPILNKLLAKP